MEFLRKSWLLRAEIVHWALWITDAFNWEELQAQRYRQHFKLLASSKLFHLCQHCRTHPWMEKLLLPAPCFLPKALSPQPFPPKIHLLARKFLIWARLSSPVPVFYGNVQPASSQRTEFPLSSGEKKGIPHAGICHSVFLWQCIQENVLPFTPTKLIPINSCHSTPFKVQLLVPVTKIKLKYKSKINSLLFLWSGQHSLARTPLTETIPPLSQASFYSHTSALTGP